MALEDCEVLARLLLRYQDQGMHGWYSATKLYSDMRTPRLRWIRKEAEKRGAMKHDMGFVQEYLMYFFIWLSGESMVVAVRVLHLVDMPCRQDWSLHEI